MDNAQLFFFTNYDNKREIKIKKFQILEFSNNANMVSTCISKLCVGRKAANINENGKNIKLHHIQQNLARLQI